MGWAGLGRASLGQPARCRMSRRSRGPWVKPLTVSRRRPALSELRRLLCTCTEMAAVEQCRVGLGSAMQAWPGGRGRTVQRERVPQGSRPSHGRGRPAPGAGTWLAFSWSPCRSSTAVHTGGWWAGGVGFADVAASLGPGAACEGRGRGSGLVEDAAPVCGSGPEHAHPACRLGRHGHTQCPVHPDDPRSGGAQLSHLRAGGAPPTRGEGSWLSGGARAACSPCRGPAH